MLILNLSIFCFYLWSNKDGQDVAPPARLLRAHPLDEVDAVGRRERDAVRVARDVLGRGHLQHAVHVDDALRHSFRLQHTGKIHASEKIERAKKEMELVGTSLKRKIVRMGSGALRECGS